MIHTLSIMYMTFKYLDKKIDFSMFSKRSDDSFFTYLKKNFINKPEDDKRKGKEISFTRLV
jgi:hypothetical protein